MSLRSLLPPLAALALVSCAGPSAARLPASPVAAVALEWPASGKALDHVEGFQNQSLKIGLISLQGGARMPEHSSGLPVLLTASSGRGTVITAGGSHPLDLTHAVFLPAGEPHSVIALEGEVLHIAVVALKSAAVAPAEPHGH